MTNVLDNLGRIKIVTGSGSGSNIWPKPDKLMIGAIEYSTIALAIAAAVSGDTIYAGVGTFVCNNQTLPSGVDLVGGDRDATIFTSSTQDKTLTAAGGNYIANVTIKNTRASVGTPIALDVAGAVEIYNILTYTDDSDSVSLHLQTGASGKIFSSQVTGNDDGIFSEITGSVTILNMEIDVVTFGLTSAGNGTVNLMDTHFANGQPDAGNIIDVHGWYFNATNDIVILNGTGLTGEVWRIPANGLQIAQGSFSGALVAASSGDTIRLLTGAYSLASTQNIGVSVTIEGDGPEATIYTSSVSNATAFDITADNITVVFRNLTIKHTGGGTAATGIFSNNSGVTVILDNCVVEISSGAGTASRGLWIESGTWVLRNGSKIDVTSGTSKYGIYNDAGAATITIGAGCTVNGATADIYSDQSGSTITLNSAVLTNGLANWAGVLNWEPEAKIVKNLLYSSMTHNLWQEGTTLNDLADDTYGPDTVWNVLNKDNAPDISGQAGGSTDPFTESFRCTFDSNTAQAGIVQFLEFEDTYPLRGQTVSLSADLWGTNVSTLRMAVIVWTSTADTLTSDVVGTWGTGNPTLATNWAYIGTPAAITISSTRTRYAVNNLLVPTNANNIGVFIWTDAAESSGDLWNVARVQLERGPAATEFVARPMAIELALVGRYFEKSYNLATTPATATAVGILAIESPAAGTGNVIAYSVFNARKRVAPTVTIYDSAGNAGKLDYLLAGTPTTNKAINATNVGEAAFYVASDATTNKDGIRWHYKADARL